MRQAIEEGFIHDVLANYVTYETYWKIEKAVTDDPEYDTGQGPHRDRPVRHAARAQPGAEGRGGRRALPHARRQADRRAGQGDGGDLLDRARDPVLRGAEEGQRPVRQQPRDPGGVLRHQDIDGKP
jgi:hypothetical protein